MTLKASSTLGLNFWQEFEDTQDAKKDVKVVEVVLEADPSQSEVLVSQPEVLLEADKPKQEVS